MSVTTEARFAGVWTVAREITDLGGGPSGRFRGIARIAPAMVAPHTAGLRYDEQGSLTLGAAKMMATRAYLWRPDGPTRVQVLFEDGRPFHAFDWGRPEWTDEHPCEADHYAVRYTFAADSWHAHWRVTGPAKNYAMSSRYLRLKPAEAGPAGPLAAPGPDAYRAPDEGSEGD
jgi:hypothetical protein